MLEWIAVGLHGLHLRPEHRTIGSHGELRHQSACRTGSVSHGHLGNAGFDIRIVAIDGTRHRPKTLQKVALNWNDLDGVIRRRNTKTTVAPELIAPSRYQLLARAIGGLNGSEVQLRC